MATMNTRHCHCWCVVGMTIVIPIDGIIAIVAACLLCVNKKQNRRHLCTSTTALLLQRRKLIRFGRNQRPRLICLTEPGCPACTVAEEARDARFPTIC